MAKRRIGSGSGEHSASGPSTRDMQRAFEAALRKLSAEKQRRYWFPRLCAKIGMVICGLGMLGGGLFGIGLVLVNVCMLGAVLAVTE